MGIGTIMKAKKILLIAGPDKAEIVEKGLLRQGYAGGAGFRFAAAPGRYGYP